MDKLLPNRVYEDKAPKHRRAFENPDKGDNLEAVESAKETDMGTAKAWCTELACLQGWILG